MAGEQYWLCAYSVETQRIKSASFSPGLIERAERVRELCIGEESACSYDKPSCTPGHYEGGIRFERSKRAVNVRNAPRCYPVGPTFQKQRSLHAPGVGSKLDGNELEEDEDVKLRKEFVEVCGSQVSEEVGLMEDVGGDGNGSRRDDEASR